MLKSSLNFVWKGCGHLTRITLVSAVLFIFVCGSLMLSLRYWLLPDIERYHGDITAALGLAIGQPVSIGKIEADWRGMRPHLTLSDVRILEKDRPGMTALALQKVDGVVSWLTLLRGEVRLYSLELDHPDLLIRRDSQGLLHIAGIALTDQPSGQGGLADWLLHQSYLVVRDARITWLDEQRGTLPLVFNQLNLLIENSRRHHRFAFRALPPSELSAQIDVRGDFYGRSFAELSAWRGQLFTQLDYADLAAWRAWLPLPPEFIRGRGALRAWLELADGKVNQITADLSMADVQAQFAATPSPLDLRLMHGRIRWSGAEQGEEILTNQLSLQTDHVIVPPTDFYLRIAHPTGKQQSEGEVRANTLELANLVSLTDSLPLGQELKNQLAEYAPQGTISGLQAKWQSESGKALKYEVKAHFDQLSMKRTAKLPGFSGLSGELEGSEATGMVSLNGRKLTLDAPQFMTEMVIFDTLSAQGSWRTAKQGMEVKFSNVSVSNSDLAGTVQGSFQTLPNSPGFIDLNINLVRAAVNHADRYIPLSALDKETHAWLRSALLDGQADEFHLRMHGDLNDFPFPENKKGIFQILARTRGVELEYDKNWPHISSIIGDLSIQGKRLEVSATSALTMGAHLQKIRVTMPDSASADLMLHVRGEAVGETSRSLDFIQHSPVHGYIDGFTDGMTAKGNGNLQLSADIPLRGSKPVTVSGIYHFNDNEVNLGNAVPVFYAVKGDLLFSESSLRTKNLTANILGGKAAAEVQSGTDGTIRAKLHGRADMDALRKNITQPLLSFLHGGCDWDAEITVQKKMANVLVTSSLYGLASDFPLPFTKANAEIVPLRFEMRSMDSKQDVISLQYGKLLNARLLRREEDGNIVVKRGTINFGGMGKWINRDGIWITGVVPQLSLAGWGGLSGGVGGASPLKFAGADLVIQELNAFGHTVNGLRVFARSQEGVFSAQLAAKEINGEVSWQSEGKGKLVARLRNLILGESGHLVKGGGGKKDEKLNIAAAGEDGARTEFPALDLKVDELFWKENQLGKMELLAQQHGRDWDLDLLRITNPDGTLIADGKYHMAEGKSQTQVNLKLEISNAGKILARSGYPDSVKNGSGKLEGEFSWRGAPDNFTYASMDGKLILDTGKGQFLKIEPGVGKLLGILSLQALPKHITLDFTDVFSDGFAFDSITGTAQIRQGVLQTNDFRLDGSSANVTMTGQVDLNRESQNLRVRILPTIGNSVSLLGAFAAGPIVGIGTFLANKILREPLDKLVSFEYNVTGSWVNPIVTKIGNPATGTVDKTAP